MSEYQHYEFHAIDKPLNSEDLDTVRGMSSRVQLSPRKASFTYSYDFLNIQSEIMKGDYRSLFIIRLRFVEDLYGSDEFNHDYSFESKLIPSNLLHLSSSGYSAKEFYGVNEDWLDVMRLYSV